MLKLFIPVILLAAGLTVWSIQDTSVGASQERVLTQEAYFQANGRYFQQLRQGDSEIHEYESRVGKGWQEIEYRSSTTRDGTFEEWRSQGYGPEAKERTWDWRPLHDPL